MSELLMAEMAVTPSTPSTGKVSLYFRAGAWYYLDASGVEVPFAATVVNPAFIDFITSGTNPAHLKGRLFWDVENNTMAFHTDIPGVTNQIGQEQYVRGRNISGGALQNGRVVYIAGVSAGRPRFEYATNTPANIAEKTIGVLTHTIANANEGLATVLGSVGDLNTSAWAAGDVLYLDATAGQLTNVKPTPSLTTMIVRIGVVLISDAVTGKIFVNPDITPVITDVGGAGTMAQQNANAVAITGGAINNTPIGGTTPNTGSFTSVGATSLQVTAPAGQNAHINYLQTTVQGWSAGQKASANFAINNGLNFAGSDIITATLGGNVGIGTSTANSKLSVLGGARLSVGDGQDSTATAKGLWIIRDLDTANFRGAAWQFNAAEGLSLFVGNGSSAYVERIRTTAAGAVTISNGVGVGNVANASPTVFDWYEEGTWTPNDQSGAGLTFTITNATYTRKGREVTVRAQLTYPATASGAAAAIGGFPFVPGVNGAGSFYAATAAGVVLQLAAGYLALPSGASVPNSTLSSQPVYLTVTYFV